MESSMDNELKEIKEELRILSRLIGEYKNKYDILNGRITQFEMESRKIPSKKITRSQIAFIICKHVTIPNKMVENEVTDAVNEIYKLIKGER